MLGNHLRITTDDQSPISGDNSPIVGYSPRVIDIKVGGDQVAKEVPNHLIKGVGRKHNMLDNMDRTFEMKGYGKKSKISMWDLLALMDVEKKKEEDEHYAQMVLSKKM